jgi:hypothetical protein
MNRPAYGIAFPLVHLKLDSGAFANVTAVFKTSGGTIVPCGYHCIVLYKDSPILSLDAGASVCKIFCAV